MSQVPEERIGLTPVQWLICVIASIGFAFDIYELLMLPLIVRPALLELNPSDPWFGDWVGWLFFAPALVGGFFGLIGGYLTDRFGRRRVLVWSILLYAFSACAAGFSTSIEMLLFLRCTTFIGVCVEFVAAVAWLAELFPNAKQREAVLGYTQFFSSLGGLMVTYVYGFAVAYADYLPALPLPEGFSAHAPWRYTLISGLIPAIPLIIVRPFLPESPAWAEKKAKGTLKRPGILQLFQPGLRQTTLVTTLIFACSYGAAFGAIQHLPRIVPGLPIVHEREEQARQQAAKDAPAESADQPATKIDPGDRVRQLTIKNVQLWQEYGGLTGRFLLAGLAIWIVSRRGLLRLFQLPGLFIIPWVFWYPATNDLDLLKIGAFLAGVFTVAQFSFWGNYLPRVFPTHLRGTGESFAANIGGRMIGTSAAMVTTTLAPYMAGATKEIKLAHTAAIVALVVYAVGFIASFWLPEPQRGELPE